MLPRLFVPTSSRFHHSRRSLSGYSRNQNNLLPAPRRPLVAVGVGVMGLGVLTHTSTPARCSMEAAPPTRSKRRRPPIFGSSIPKVTTRGLVTNTSDTTIPNNISDREDCPLCKKFGRGPCGDFFKRWLACTDEYAGKGAGGEPLHLSKCSDFAEILAKCLDENTSYYSEENHNGNHQNQDGDAKVNDLKDAWREFVLDMENGIASGKFNLEAYPDYLNPKVELQLASLTGAAFFVPEKDGHPLIAAYILDNVGNVIAAGSKEDMDMGSLGCILQFKVTDDIESTTVRAVYDTSDDEIAVFSRSMLLPIEK